MLEVNRRDFLAFLGGSAATAALASLPVRHAFASGALPIGFTPVRLPGVLPVYLTNPSVYVTAINSAGSILPASADAVLASYTVADDVIVPPEFERYTLAGFGDRVFPNPDDYIGYNHDFTGYLPLRGTDDGLYFINHEYVSYPFHQITPETPGSQITSGLRAFEQFVNASIPAGGSSVTLPSVVGAPATPAAALAALAASDRRLLLGESLYNVGGSILRIRRTSRGGRFAVMAGDAYNRRVHGLSGLAINAGRTDGYAGVTSWGALARQTGDDRHLVGTGPAALQVFPSSSDGLGNRIIGTINNCSGGVTPWGTIMSAEENFQGSSGFFVGVQEDVLPNGRQTGYVAATGGQEFGLVGEKYGWMVEIDASVSPGTGSVAESSAQQLARGKKHTALGRFRHENITFRCDPGNRLIAYMGDDRRGGHTWKYVSNATVVNRTDKSNSDLLADGTLYVARFNPNGTGTWIPFVLSTATNPIAPTDLQSAQLAAQGNTTGSTVVLRLPRRNGIAGQAVDGGAFNITPANQGTTLAGYQNKTLADFYTTQGALLCDGYLAANLAGGTPGARPEDLEVHPETKEVFIAYTDGRDGGDGYPDSRIFVVAKYTAAINEVQQNGGLYKIREGSADGAGTTFTWERFKQGGEAGSNTGSGFSNLDNLAFDSVGNVWGVTDMTTSLHNGFNIPGAGASVLTVNHAAVGGSAAQNLVGSIGNNFLFVIPSSGPAAGVVVPFAIGPVRCEMTGPCFVGNTLLVAVQHPGEGSPVTGANAVDAAIPEPSTVLSRSIEMLKLDGTLVNQTRNVPAGSQWPSNIEGKAHLLPRPTIVGIRRRNGAALV